MMKLTSATVSSYCFSLFVLTFSGNSRAQYVGPVLFKAKLLVMTIREYYKF